MNVPPPTRRLLLAALILAGCAQTATVPTTTLVPLPVPAQTTTTTTTVPPVEVIGYGQAIIDGRTFQLSVGKETQLVTLTHLTVPDPSTCEGIQAKNLLGSLVIGQQVRLGNDGVVRRNDSGLDVAKTLVQYGMAKAADATYEPNDATSVDFNCANTTTTATIAVVVEAPPPVQQPRPRPKPTTPRPKRTTPPQTTAEAPVETDAPIRTEPPVVQPPQPDPAPPETPPPEEGRHHGKPPPHTRKPKGGR